MTDAEYIEYLKRGRPKKVDYLREIGLIKDGRVALNPNGEGADF